MYGLEKGKENKFSFDLEKEIKEQPERRQKLIKKAEERAQEIKKALREGASDKDFDSLGLLLHGYSALQKVLNKTGK